MRQNNPVIREDVTYILCPQGFSYKKTLVVKLKVLDSKTK
jgi:hypothetical protein